MSAMTHPPMTGNRLIAYNLRALRTARGLTQDQASALLAPYVEVPWSRATFSAAERSAEGDRVRGFTADDILALALAFDVPVTYFFLPPLPRDRHTQQLVLESAGRRVEWDDLIRGPVLGRDTWSDSVRPRVLYEEGVLPLHLANLADQLVRQRLAEKYGETTKAVQVLEETVALLRAIEDASVSAISLDEIRHQLAEAGIDDGEPEQ
jgi:transcriptional regulator with XRE-family HTH domain